MSKLSARIYAKSSNKRFIIPLKKIVILQLPSIFLVSVLRNTLIPSVKMTLMNKMLAGIICQTIEREVDYPTANKNCYFGFYFQ